VSIWEECPACGFYHPIGYTGDCRDDGNQTVDLPDPIDTEDCEPGWEDLDDDGLCQSIRDILADRLPGLVPDGTCGRIIAKVLKTLRDGIDNPENVA